MVGRCVHSQETECLCLAWYLLLNLQFKGGIYTRLYAFRLGLHTSVDLILIISYRAVQKLASSMILDQWFSAPFGTSHIRYPAHQIFILSFITVAKLQ